MKQYLFNAGARPCNSRSWRAVLSANALVFRATLKHFVDECCILDPQGTISRDEMYSGPQRATRQGRAGLSRRMRRAKNRQAASRGLTCRSIAFPTSRCAMRRS